MSEKSKYADILGLDFFCLDEHEDDECAALKGDYYFSDTTGKYICSKCLSPLALEMHDDREDLYDEEDDQDSGAMNEDSYFVAEGDRSMIDWTPDAGKRYSREDRIIELVNTLEDDKLTTYMTLNQREIVDELRKQEQSDVPLFRDTGTQRLAPKIIAVASYLMDSPPNRPALVKLGISPRQTLKLYNYLQRVGRPDREPKIEMTFLQVGKQMDMPESLIRSALEEYETSRPVSSVTNDYSKIVAWLILMSKKYGFKITQKAAIEKTGAPRNATRKALKDFKEFISNLKVSKETPTAHGLKERDDME